MKILHIINTLAIGGAQSVLTQLLEGWGNGSDQQMVISLRNREQLSGRIEALNIPVEHINLQPDKVELVKFLQLVRIIKRYKPDIVQTWLYHADLIGGLAVRLAGLAPIVWGVHHTMTNRHSVKSSTFNIVRILSLLSNFLPSHIICCSQSAYQTHVDFGYKKNKMSVIVNGVDTDRFRPDPFAREVLLNELGLSTQTKLIGMFARFHPQKGHDTLINAAGAFLKKKPNIHFVLAGEGIDTSNKELQDKIYLEGISGNFHLLGSRQDMPQLNAGVDVVTLTSSYGEALPMTLCEAMSCGTPCVATSIGDTAALIGNTGLIVEPKNSQALADAWQNMLELQVTEYDLLSYQARQRILEFYNLANMINEYKSIYQELMTSQ